MPETAVGLDFDKPLDVHRNVFAQIAFDLAFGFDDLTDTVDLVFAEILNLPERVNVRGSQNAERTGVADPENVGERDPGLLVPRQIDASNTCHSLPFMCSGKLLSGAGG
jgi:hypothetical protein